MTRRSREITGALPRRALMRGVTAGSVAAYLGGAAGPAVAAEGGPFPAHPRWKFVFVNHVTANPFFVPCQYGIQDACALLGCDYQWTGSETSDVAQMVNAMNTAIAGKADAIAVGLVDPKGFDRPVENALAAGIPVFSYNADAKTNKRLAYIGQDLFLSGQMMGERIVKLVGSGKVAIFIATPGQLNLQPRFDGAMDSIKKSGADIQATMIATAPAANESLSKIDARKGRVVELRYFAGLSVEETGEALSISAETAKRDWKMAKAWLLRELTGAQSEAAPRRSARN